MNHFEEFLCQGDNVHHHTFHQNQQIYDKSTNQSNIISTSYDHMISPFDRSPKASMCFFSLNSPRHNTDNFQFNNQNHGYSKNCRDHIQPITRRLQFQQDASVFCQEQQLQQEQPSVKQEEVWNYQSSQVPEKNKKIKKTKNSKGLKNLSIGVYQIVAQMSQTSYKQVANALIEKLSKRVKQQANTQRGYDPFKSIQKDQHNIKRRVYDALNVLISAQLLRKQGKKVICNYNLMQQKGNKQYLQHQLQKYSYELKMKQNFISQKRKKLLQLRKKYQQISLLLQKNQSLGPDYPQKIKLPFIVVKSQQDDVKKVNINHRDTQIQFNGNILIMGDIDTIQQLNLSPYNQCKIQQELTDEK